MGLKQLGSKITTLLLVISSVTQSPGIYSKFSSYVGWNSNFTFLEHLNFLTLIGTIKYKEQGHLIKLHFLRLQF